MNTDDMKERVIVAIDVQSAKDMHQILERLEWQPSFVKLGMELFHNEGPRVIEPLKERGINVFLDLKFHEIPSTIRNVMKNMATLGVDMISLHISGGSEMMKAALEGLESGTPKGQPLPLLIGITQLTSISQEILKNEIGIQGTVEETVVQYAKLAKRCGLHGVVASPWEVTTIKEACGDRFLTVTPGIREKILEADDQLRVTTPVQAFRLGADYIVVGRMITRAENPLRQYRKVLKDLEKELSDRTKNYRANMSDHT